MQQNNIFETITIKVWRCIHLSSGIDGSLGPNWSVMFYLSKPCGLSLVCAKSCTLARPVSARGCLRLKFLCFQYGFKRHINDFKGRYLFLFLWKLCWQMGVNVFRWSNLPSVRQIITTSISLILPHPPVEPNRVKRNIFESGLTLIFYILNIN